MEDKNCNFLLTGASGFLGMEICNQLINAGYPLIAIQHQAPTAANVLSLPADITELEQLEAIFQKYAIQTIIHAASLLNTNSNQNPDLAFRVNVLGSYNLLECARKYQVKRFIYASSFSLIGHRPLEDCPVDESQIPIPDNFYGETKHFVERLGIGYALKFGFEFAAGRMGTLVGPGKATSTSSWRMDIFNRLKTGGPIITKYAPQVRLPISGVEDTARALITLATAEKLAHPIYHLPHDDLALEEVAAMVKSLRADAKFTFGDSTEVDMPPLISFQRFTDEFSNFKHLPLVEALLEYKLS